MGEELSTSVECAWQDYRRRLVERLRTLPPKASFVIVDQSAPNRHAHRVLVSLTGAKRIRATIGAPTTVTSDWILTDSITALQRIGWCSIRDDSLCIERGQLRAEELSTRIVTTLREVFRTSDPSVLTDTDTNTSASHVPDTESAVRVRDSDHLRALVIDALGPLITPCYDADNAIGDIVLSTSPVPTWIHIDPQDARLEFCTSLSHAASPIRAAQIIAEQHLRSPGITLVSNGAHMYARLALEAVVFHQANLESAVSHWTNFLAEEAPLLAESLDEDFDDDGAKETRPVPRPLRSIISVDPDFSILQPTDIVEICDHDPDTLVDILRVCLRQCMAWQQLVASSSDHEESTEDRTELAEWCAAAQHLVEAARVLTLPDDATGGAAVA